MIISAAGKINHDEFVEMIKKSCTNLPVGNSNNREKANYLSGEYREEKKLEQVHLLLGFEGIDYHHDDYYSLLVFSSLLGGGMSSRLFQEIGMYLDTPDDMIFFFWLDIAFPDQPMGRSVLG